MSRTKTFTLVSTTLAVLTGAVVCGASISGCGKVGPLDQPPPLYGQRAKAAYYAQRASQANAAAQNAADQRSATGSAERTVANPNDATVNTTGGSTPAGDPNANDAPLTTRDVQDPDQKMTSPRDAPVPGAPNSAGPTPSLTPPNS